MKIDGKDAVLQKGVCRCGTTSSEIMPFETLTSQTALSSSRKQRISVPSRAELFLLEPLRKCADTGSEVTLKKKKA